MQKRILITAAAIICLFAAGIVGYLVVGNGFAPTVAQAGGPGPVYLQQAGADVNTGILVAGQGKVAVKPNIAIANIGVDITTANLSEATSQANTKMTAVIDKLKSLGIEEKDIQTTNYSLYPITQPNPKAPDANTPPAITGYHVTNQAQVTVRKINDLGKILDAALSAGANNIYGVSFGVDDMSTYQQQARAAAIKNAQDKATQIAKSANVTLGPVLSITEGSSIPGPIAASQPRAFGLGGGEVPVQTGELQVTVDVSMRFGIKQ